MGDKVDHWRTTDQRQRTEKNIRVKDTEGESEGT